ncbi:MAG TPA: hypothetical protein VL652_03880 [Kutzneria sp.]|nr:hypothetical protein [Kutzneria sp.]
MTELVSMVALVVILIRMTVVLRRHGMRMFSFGPWKSVPRSDWRRLMRAMRRGEPVPVELLGVAREWARRQLLIRIQAWIPVVMIPLFASGLRADIIDPSPWGPVAFWMIIVGMVVMVPGGVQTWRDNQIAARVFRDTAPTA